MGYTGPDGAEEEACFFSNCEPKSNTPKKVQKHYLNKTFDNTPHFFFEQRKEKTQYFKFFDLLNNGEQQFMLKLGLDDAMAPLDVLEVKGAAVEVTQETALQGAGGHADTDLFNPALFWEPPPIRLFLLRARDRRIVTDLTC